MNHEWGSPDPPSCAVPHLPATVTFGSAAPVVNLRPQSLFTACTIARLTWAATSGVTARPSVVGLTAWTVPSAATNAVARCGPGTSPRRATVAATRAIWSGVTSVSPCPYEALASSTSSAKPPGRGPVPFVSWEVAVGRSNGMLLS